MAPALIGRERQASLIRAEVGRTVTSHGGLVLVAGEAGVGKTALVTRMMHDAAADGATVASGACWDREGAPGYWPWVQVIRSLERQLEADAWKEAVEAAGDGLTFLVGDITEPPAVGDLDTAAFGLYDSVTTLLATLARDRPVIIALDDLHWADVSSLRMLDFVVRHTWFERVLVVGTYRDVETEIPGHPLRQHLRPLEMKAATVILTGLDVEGVRELNAELAGEAPSEQHVTEIHRRTGGNPLFVEQMARLRQVGSLSDVAPPGIRDAVERHLSYVPKPILNLLTDAAVIGPEFHRPVLAAVSGLPVAEAHQLLQQATATRLVAPLGGGRFEFAHDLVREILYDYLDADEQRRRHAAVIHALKESNGDDAAPSHLAHHAYSAVPDISAQEAIRFLLAAGREASCRLASEEAGTHFRRALELVPDDLPRRRASILFALSDQQRRTGQRDAARQTLGSVIALAEQLDDSTLLATAKAAHAELAEPAEPAAEAEAPAAGDGANVFRFDGSVWTLTFAGRTAHVPDAKGLRDLHVLLGRPGVDVSVVELLTAGGDGDARAARRLGGDPVLDDTAKAQYRRRLTQLDEEIDRALDRRDDDRAAELDHERKALLDELRGAAGLSGRSRRLGDEAERSRKTVTARIRDTLRRLDDRHPELAQHLQATVSTGVMCRYRPGTDVRWDL